MAADEGGLWVDRDNVLAAARVVQDVLDDRGARLHGLLGALRVPPPGEDPVSTAAAQAWQERIATDPDSHANRIRDYLTGLEQLVGNLTDTARQYGYTDDEIDAALRRTAT